MRSIDQRDFTFQDWCCWLASAVHMAFNNIIDKDIDTNDISNFALKEYGRPLWLVWSPVKAGINVMIPYLQKRYNVFGVYRVITLFWKHFNNLLDRWVLISVNIDITEAYNELRKWWKKIEWDFSNSNVVWWHWFCVFRKDWKDYILNSWNPKYNIREVDFNTKWLFVWTKAFILY